MRFIAAIFLFISTASFGQNQFETYFEKGNGNQSATYAETISYYKVLANHFKTIELKTMGQTDAGEPLHIVIFNPDKNFNFEQIRKNKAVLLINNGIHAGEPDGIDATMMLFRDLAMGKIKALQHTVVVAIPVYNIGGALNRNSTSRVNQEGPEAYGFRGNSRNYDLNRDFIKSDAKETRSFVEIFRLADADVFIDNHVSDGADYQYTLTYIMTQPDKLGKPLGDYFKNEMMPSIVSKLKLTNLESTPYVNAWTATPDKGFTQFFETPRYATGYTALFNTIGFVVETHMLKKFSDRVKANYAFMLEALQYTDANAAKITSLRIQNQQQYAPGKTYPIKWQTDSTKVSTLSFLGYEGGYKKSDATTGNRLYYDRKQPYERAVRYFDSYKPVKDVTIPKAYVVPKSCWNVIDLLKANQLRYSEIKKDTVIVVESYRISDYKTAQQAYEGHYPHNNTKVTATTKKITFHKGDFIFPTQQQGMKYLLETLEPEAMDSFFNWNFFDTILQQKEGYSDYVFEDLAAKLLAENPEMKAALDEKRKADSKFAASPDAQLDWIYKNSAYYESAHLQYPIYRIVD